MTSDEATQEKPVAYRERGTFFYQEPDFLLETLAEIGGFGVTLYVAGNVICGEIIKAHDYIEGIADLMDQAVGAPLGDTFRDMDRPDDSDAEIEMRNLTRYIHLSKARFLSGGSVFPGNWSDVKVGSDPQSSGHPNYWRGRLTHVDGWSFGTFD